MESFERLKFRDREKERSQVDSLVESIRSMDSNASVVDLSELGN